MHPGVSASQCYNPRWGVARFSPRRIIPQRQHWMFAIIEGDNGPSQRERCQSRGPHQELCRKASLAPIRLQTWHPTSHPGFLIPHSFSEFPSQTPNLSYNHRRYLFLHCVCIIFLIEITPQGSLYNTGHFDFCDPPIGKYVVRQEDT